MTDLRRLTTGELVAFVQSALREAGMDTVLSGGNCVSVWTVNAYLSDDIDRFDQSLCRCDSSG